MIDFTIDTIGDIVLAPARQYPSFTINIYTPDGGRKYNAFRINFDTDIPKYQETGSGFRIDFYTDLYMDNTVYFTTAPILDKAELAQEILIRLKTELGEFVYIPELGSRIVLERHEDICSSVSLNNIKQYVDEAIADVDFEDAYTVTVERIDDESRFRYETIRITIDTGKTEHYESTI